MDWLSPTFCSANGASRAKFTVISFASLCRSSSNLSTNRISDLGVEDKSDNEAIQTQDLAVDHRQTPC